MAELEAELGAAFLSADLGITPESPTRARKPLALSQGDLARKASVRQPLISELENGAINATLDTVLKVLAALELDLTLTARTA